MVVDLDGFKNVNDSLGHLTGDALLIAVADRFDEHLRDFDTIARLGGDEFAILVDDLDAPDQAGTGRATRARRAARAAPASRPRASRSEPASASRSPIAPTSRPIGSSATPTPRCTRRSDKGKGCYRVFEAAMHTAAVERMNLEQALRTASRPTRSPSTTSR